MNATLTIIGNCKELGGLEVKDSLYSLGIFWLYNRYPVRQISLVIIIIVISLKIYFTIFKAI